MDEEQVYSLEIDGQFFENDEPFWAHGTAGEILEQVADELGIEEDTEEEEDTRWASELELIYPSRRALKAHQMFEDRLGRPGFYPNPDSLIEALIAEGLARHLSPDELEAFLEAEELEEYEEARGEIDEEWRDGVWEM